jgi:hypothetical protein
MLWSGYKTVAVCCTPVSISRFVFRWNCIFQNTWMRIYRVVNISVSNILSHVRVTTRRGLKLLHIYTQLITTCMYVCSGAGFPMHCDLYVVYCTFPVNFKSAAMPSRRDGTARPTYQRTAEPSPWRRNWRLCTWAGNVRNFAQMSPWCSKSTTRVKRLKVPPGGLRSLNFSVLTNSTTSAGFEPASLGSWGGNVTSRPRRPLITTSNTALPLISSLYNSLLHPLVSSVYYSLH